MTEITIETQFQLKNVRHGRRRIVPKMRTEAAEPVVAPAEGRVPRVARLMALAIHFERLVAEGHVKDFADIARLGHVTRARATQIMNLTLLAPDIQEEILHLPLVEAGRDPIKEWQLRPITGVPDWAKQRRLWRELMSRAGTSQFRDS